MVAREHVTVLVAVPVAYLAMLALADFDGYDTSSLMVCATGGALCPPTLALEIKQRALIAALLERTQASRDVGRYRAEIAELERIIKPRRHRKAAAQPDAAPDVAPAVKPRRSRKAGAK